MSRKILIISIAVLAAAGAFAVFLIPEKLHEGPVRVPEAHTATTTESASPTLSYGEVRLGLGETAVFEHLRLTPLRIEQDSRCPSDVQCIQAGTVTVLLQVVSGMGTSTSDLSLGDFMTTEAERVDFVAVKPESNSTRMISDDEYVFTFAVTKKQSDSAPEAVLPEPKSQQGACYIGGCSSQLCTDTKDMASTCEYREAYACYQNAICERQVSGECGWTQTAELSACLRTNQ